MTLVPQNIKINVSLPINNICLMMRVIKPLRRNFNNGQTKIWSKGKGKDNKTATAKWHNILLQLGFFDLEKIRSWGIRSGMARGEQVDHSVPGENHMYTSLFVS